ncbi:hypothetical protein DUNSADRAFT_16301 [Dunaliella salina]|uniref:Secreted protein n=1 Tax=Dunaliella salina TaxID=3046 RepID=A0ABQ7G3V9_DUNSA|nr:hypothetical protein DUNSADRAFT_16301 [Dunaliella salina]|eukprot:KAF5829281.1 hypothetical protein DUNSADRAFT_16301 [Dunaliella salina]
MTTRNLQLPACWVLMSCRAWCTLAVLTHQISRPSGTPQPSATNKVWKQQSPTFCICNLRLQAFK